jgi:hypothetical protein
MAEPTETALLLQAKIRELELEERFMEKALEVARKKEDIEKELLASEQRIEGYRQGRKLLVTARAQDEAEEPETEQNEYSNLMAEEDGRPRNLDDMESYVATVQSLISNLSDLTEEKWEVITSAIISNLETSGIPSTEAEAIIIMAVAKMNQAIAVKRTEAIKEQLEQQLIASEKSLAESRSRW